MDPISIISLAASATKASYDVSLQLYNFINSVKNVDDTVYALSSELSSLRRSLDALSNIFQNPVIRTQKATALENIPIWAAAAGALNDCRRTLAQFEQVIAPAQDEKNRRGIFRRSATVWKLKASKDDLDTLRAQIQSHTHSLQLALQMINILVSGLSPAHAVEEIGQRIDDLSNSLRAVTIDGRAQGPPSDVEKVARQLLEQAPEFITTGYLQSSSEEVRQASVEQLRSVLTEYNKSFSDIDIKMLTPSSTMKSDGDDWTEPTDTDDDDDDDDAIIATRVAAEHCKKASEKFAARRWAEAEVQYRDGLRQLGNAQYVDKSVNLSRVRLELALCCFYQEKFQEAEIIMLMLCKELGPTSGDMFDVYHYLAQIYLCMYDFESALEYSSMAVKGRRKIEGKTSKRYQQSLRLMSLVYEANGDVITGNAYAERIAKGVDTDDTNHMVIERFSGFSQQDHLLLSLHDKREALRELSESNILSHMRPSRRNDYWHGWYRTDITEDIILFKPNRDALNLEKVLTYAADNNQKMLAKWALARGANTHGTLQNSAAIIIAASQGFAEIVQLLLDCGVDVNSADRDNRTSLLWASLWGHESTVRVLLEHKADTSIADSSGDAPLEAAAVKGHTSVMAMLLKAGADINGANKRGHTALLQAFGNNNADSIVWLIEHGADIEMPRDSSETPLMMAVNERKPTVLKLLLEKGADVHARDRLGNTPLLLMYPSSGADVAKMLLDYGADIHATNNAGMTALGHLADDGAVDLIKLLLERGADPNGADERGETPAAKAKHRNNRETYEVLKSWGEQHGIKIEDCITSGKDKDCLACTRFS